MRLPSGRDFYANCGIIGIDESGSVTEGYDGSVGIWDKEDGWSASERKELAAIMIERWERFAALTAPPE